MFNSMLGSITSSFIFDIFIVFAIVIAGTVICYFAGEAIASTIKDRKNREKKPARKKNWFLIKKRQTQRK